MDLSTLTLNSATALIQYILGPATLIFISSGVIIYWRSGSSHALLLKLWSIFAGQANIKSPSVAKFADDERDLAHFRFMSRAKVSTLRDAERLISWSTQYNVSIHLLRASGEYFDLEKPAPRGKLFSVKRTKLVLPFLCFVALSAILVVGVYFVAQDRALIRMTASGNYFEIDENYISRALSNEKLSWGDCKRKDIVPSISGSDREAFCAAKVDKALILSIRENILTQQAGGWIVSAEALVALLAVTASANTVVSARKLRSKLRAQGIGAPYQAQLSST